MAAMDQIAGFHRNILARFDMGIGDTHRAWRAGECPDILVPDHWDSSAAYRAGLLSHVRAEISAPARVAADSQALACEDSDQWRAADRASVYGSDRIR